MEFTAPQIVAIEPGHDAWVVGEDDDALLRPTMSEPAEGVRQYEGWRAERSQRLVAGVVPEFSVRRITEAETLPEGVSEGEVEIIRLDVPAIAAVTIYLSQVAWTL